MARTKLYAAIYVVLFALATAQVAVEYAGILGTESLYWVGFGLIMVLSAVKAVVVAGYYQHLRWEPRSVSYLVLIGLAGAVALTVAAAYSIT
jgi:cytochrome c oxidase subunit 4